jgi:hypothetical protein
MTPTNPIIPAAMADPPLPHRRATRSSIIKENQPLGDPGFQLRF